MQGKSLFLAGLLILFAGINLVGVFGPELGFDALWYHLTIPKLYLQHGSVYSIPGGLLYYSNLPRLMEILFIPLLAIGDERLVHLLNWTLGILILIILYRLARHYLNSFYSFLTLVIFYITPLVGWQSQSAYVDLGRTLLELAAFYLVIKQRYFSAGVTWGLAVATKSLALGTGPILGLIICLQQKSPGKLFPFVLGGSLVVSPWLASAFLNTGYPLYPVGAGILDQTHVLFPSGYNPMTVIRELFKVFVWPADPINPIYLAVSPLVILKAKELVTNSKWQPIVVYFLGTALLWWLSPRTGGGRFILPYLPVWAILASYLIATSDLVVRRSLLVIAVFLAIFHTGYRLAANWRLWPLLSGQMDREEYICRRLDLVATRTFVDCDGSLGKLVGRKETLLVIGVHNLYYLDRPFIHESWYRGEKVPYVLVQGELSNSSLARMFSSKDLRLVWQNDRTKSKLYRWN